MVLRWLAWYFRTYMQAKNDCPIFPFMRKTLYSNKHMFIRYFMWRNANKMHFEHAKMVNFELMHCFLGYVQHKPIGLKILSPYHLGWLPGCVNFSLKNRRPGVFCDWIRESYFPPPKKKKFLEWIAQLPRYTTINLFEQMHIYIYIFGVDSWTPAAKSDLHEGLRIGIPGHMGYIQPFSPEDWRPQDR